ncbi:hypothetical protein [Nocardioides sp.]|uniref:hypothetical protein n=1 Tax=Nocardioides sp. TaxID=35761 RepID=UPI0035B422DA
MKKPSSRTQKILAAATTPVAIVAAGAMVYQASYAAFTGQTRNSGNEWSTGSVNLTDDDNGQARFRVGNMLPNDTETKCVKVTANASVPSTVKGFTINPVTSVQGLENRLMITIVAGTGGSFTDCTGFVPVADATNGVIVANAPLSMVSQKNTFETALGGWDVPAGISTRTYKITWKFDTNGMTQAQIDQLQGAKTGVDIQWEMRSTETP